MNAAIASPNAPSTADSRASASSLSGLAAYVVAGMFLGIVMVKSEIIFWVRIQEMFRFESFHMYGVLGSAFLTAFISLRILMHLGARSRAGDGIRLGPKEMKKGHRYWIGGAMFGVGWVLCGACPGPLFALIGSGRTVFVVTALAALLGTWTYGILRPHLPH